jgi:hypothetical protein
LSDRGDQRSSFSPQPRCRLGLRLNWPIVTIRKTCSSQAERDGQL